jgi:Zn-dependent oligopeptidase
MSMDDAETLFHEFGHALQAMLTRVKEPLAAGMR